MKRTVRPSRPQGRPPVDEITKPQRKTLAEIERFVRRHNIPPTVQELADILGITAASAQDQVNQLVRKGYLTRQPRKARSLRVVRTVREAAGDLVALPIVGRVAAGQPWLAEEYVTGEVLVDAALAGSGQCFGLTVAGNSMHGADIRDGDIVIVRQQPLAENGEIVVALVDGEATVKRLSMNDGTIELRPENPKHKPIPIGLTTDLRIVGKVVGVRRVQRTAR